jgi:hypothetical protein
MSNLSLSCRLLREASGTKYAASEARHIQSLFPAGAHGFKVPDVPNEKMRPDRGSIGRQSTWVVLTRNLQIHHAELLGPGSAAGECMTNPYPRVGSIKTINRIVVIVFVFNLVYIVQTRSPGKSRSF